MFRNAYTQQNLTSENYIGIARSGAADTAGAIIDTQGNSRQPYGQQQAKLLRSDGWHTRYNG